MVGISFMKEQEDKVNDEILLPLKQQGYSTGLAKIMASDMTKCFPMRFWLVDNSYSMSERDGHKFVETTKRSQVYIMKCTRWEEIQQTVSYHARMAATLLAPTSFRLLNHPGGNYPQSFGVAEGPYAKNIQHDMYTAIDTMEMTRPCGLTPLVEHILEIQNRIREMSPQLRARGERVALIIATDGLPTNSEGYGGQIAKEEFRRALRRLETLPVWVVIRLCTDDEEVVQFYNGLDQHLELSLEVLDDFIGEAKEVFGHNKWLTYGLPLHRCREFGFHDRLFDAIDERPLTKYELRCFCALLFGLRSNYDIPDPEEDWSGFKGEVKRLLKKECNQYNPMTKKMNPWINMFWLELTYGRWNIHRLKRYAMFVAIILFSLLWNKIH
mmetsp:Transcript_21544/g.32891  ORF Transcript_21544/g.32891 Transcript_21544/m.32891 type:complete len:383 (-) Transcript_21544:177-1325(-)